MSDLPQKVLVFVAEYLKDLNGKQAAIRAGYSKRTAEAQASRLLSNVKVAAAVAAGQQARAERTQIDADWVLKRLAAEAEADLGDLYDEDGNLKPIKDWPTIWRQGLVQGIEVEELFEGKGEDREHIGRVRKIKLDNRVKRIELIGKHVQVQAFREQVGLSNPDGSPLQPVVNVTIGRP